VFSTRPHVSGYLAGQDELLVAVPPAVRPEAASLAYLTQLGLAALRQVAYEPGECVAVVGLGVIGLCTVALANAIGARVTAIGNSDLRQQLALEIGAASAWLSGTEDIAESTIDVVVLTANSWAAYEDAVKLARQGGRVAVLGFPGRAQPPPAFNPLDAQWLYRKQLSIVGSGFSPAAEAPVHGVRFNLRRNLALILDYLARDRLPLERIITHRLPAGRMKEAYELAVVRDKTMAAAIFDWRAG
jgi:threonine dehydrogenase-like Zn-dependent dehydrogenase